MTDKPDNVFEFSHGKRERAPATEEPIDGAALLSALADEFNRYLRRLPEGAADMLALWAAKTHVFRRIKWRGVASHIYLRSPVPGCAKTLLLMILDEVVHDGEYSTNVSFATLYPALNQGRTPLLDEGAHWIKPGTDLMATLNGSYNRKGSVRRKFGGVSVPFSIYGLLAAAATAHQLPRDFEQRCHILDMVKPRRGEPEPPEFRADRVEHLEAIKKGFEQWADQISATVEASDPEMPEGFTGRRADNIRLELAIADAARGDWPQRARRAAVLLDAAADPAGSDAGALIADCLAIFNREAKDRLTSAVLTDGLITLDRSYRNLTPKGLSVKLGLFKIKPNKTRDGRGYDRDPFDAAADDFWIDLDDTEGLPAPATSATPATAKASSVDAYMTVLPVAEATFQTTKRVILSVLADQPFGDFRWAEPCAGSGNLLRQMPAEQRIGFDINPLDAGEFGIIRCDYRQQRLDPTHPWLVLTNASFGRQPGDPQGGPQTCFAWAAEQPCVLAIAMIVPSWFERHTIENRLHRFFHRVHREELPSNSFLHNGQVADVSALFDVWVRRDYQRDLVNVRVEHADWLWLPVERRAEADVWMQNWNIACGDIKTPDNLGRVREPASHWFIKEVRPGTIERLKCTNWREVAYPTMQTPRLHKAEVVAAYIAKYGDPDAPDYAPSEPTGDQTEPVIVESVVEDAPAPAASPVGVAPSGAPDTTERDDRLVIWGNDDPDHGRRWHILRCPHWATPGLTVNTVTEMQYYTPHAARKAAKRWVKKLGLLLDDVAWFGDPSSPITPEGD